MTAGDLTGRTLGEFILGDKLDEGGHGVLYRARQPALGRDVVIKVMRVQRRGSLVAQERFLREAQLASRLDHPYAAHIYASAIEASDGLMWIAMELVHGITLEKWLLGHGAMSLDQLVPFIEHAAEVVHDAHLLDIIHRDLKPSNLMVIERGGHLLTKLLDFGVAKAPPELPDRPLAVGAAPAAMPAAAMRRRKHRTDRLWGARRGDRVTVTDPEDAGAVRPGPLTGPGSGIGSFAYMAPEQWRGAGSVGPAADIYALGVIIYRCLAGIEPFVGRDAGDLYRLHHDAQPPRLGGELAPVDRVLGRALAKSPSDRHATALDLAADLRAALRATEREQLRAAAQQWDDRHRSPGLLWGREERTDLERWARRPPGVLTPLEHAFVTASRRRVHRATWLRHSLGLVISALVLVFGGLQYRSIVEERWASREAAFQTQLAATTIAQSEREQGRSGLLLGEADAVLHLARAYHLDPVSAIGFMLARAVQSRLAELVRLPASSGRMWSSSFSPDSKRLVTSDDQLAQIWDTNTGRLLRRLPHGATVYQATYSAGGKQIVTACDDGRVRIWESEADSPPSVLTFHRTDGHSTRYGKLSLNQDRHLVAAIDISGDVTHIWNMQTGQPLAEVRNARLYFPGLAFSADGRWLATTGGQDVQVHDTQTWRVSHTIRAGNVRGLAASSSSPRLLLGTTTGEVSMWDLPTGDRTRRLRESGEPVDAVAWSPDDRWVAAASRDGTVEIWSSGTGDLVSRFQARHAKLRAIEFDRTSQLLLSAGTDGATVIADVALGMPVSVLDGPANVVWTAHFDPSSSRVAGASWDGTARIWAASPPYRRWSAPAVSDDCGVVTTAVPDSRYIAVGCRDKVTRVWDTAQDRLLAELPATTPVGGELTSAFPAVSTNGDRAAIAQGNAVQIYALPGERPLSTIDLPAAVTAIAFAPTSHDIASGSIDGSLIVSREVGALLRFPRSPGGIDSIAFTPDGGVIASDAERHLRAYDRGGAFLADIELPYRVMSLRIEGSRAVALPIDTGNAAPPILIDLDLHRVIARLDGHVGWVFSARWLPGTRLLTAGGDGTARLWDGATGQLLRTYQGGARLLSDAVATKDGLIVAGGIDGMLRFWDGASGSLLWTLPVHRSQVVGVHVEGADLVTRGISGDLARWTIPPADQVIRACDGHEPCASVRR